MRLLRLTTASDPTPSPADTGRRWERLVADVGDLSTPAAPPSIKLALDCLRPPGVVVAELGNLFYDIHEPAALPRAHAMVSHLWGPLTMTRSLLVKGRLEQVDPQRLVETYGEATPFLWEALVLCDLSRSARTELALAWLAAGQNLQEFADWFLAFAGRA